MPFTIVFSNSIDIVFCCIICACSSDVTIQFIINAVLCVVINACTFTQALGLNLSTDGVSGMPCLQCRFLVVTAAHS